ncbi:unnamed protein product [Anisakis simplex]|uniref:MAM domain-containing protein n=1 Tax=Anisakis simplex TaxID=6269 RepID=A0A0M3JSS5_ANISI|nr:unnamed protein product [Anisakis simplex]
MPKVTIDHLDGLGALSVGAYRGLNPYAHALAPGSTHHVETSLDEMESPSALNCHVFDETCRWSNTNEDELDWKMRGSAREAEGFITTLASSSLPDLSAAVLTSTRNNGWEAGQLISDQLPCITSPLQLTATVWRSHAPTPYELPNLQVCSRNVHSDLPLSNCNLFPIKNGVPVTVNVPLPKDLFSPVQIVLVGDNFVGSDGGAIFLQDLYIDGHIDSDCSATGVDTQKQFASDQALSLSESKTLHPLRTDKLLLPSLSAMSNLIPSPPKKRLNAHSVMSLESQSASSSSDHLYETCLTLSCNPAETQCKWRSEGDAWLKASTHRSSNPLTGVHIPPTGSTGYLVAPFTDDNPQSSYYQMISPTVNVPFNEGALYFCFNEYFATDGLRLAICIDRSAQNCFYSKSDINIETNIEVRTELTIVTWQDSFMQMLQSCQQRTADGILSVFNFQVVHTRFSVAFYLLIPCYVSIVAQNRGANRGDIGFVPVRVTRDPSGSDAVC